MFGLVSDEATRDRIKAAAYEGFLSDRIHVASYFTKSNGWMSADEETFRNMCAVLFAPKMVKEEDKKLLEELKLKEPRLTELNMNFYENQIE
jgi:F0F1-type ATP synthase beta subunit